MAFDHIHRQIKQETYTPEIRTIMCYTNKEGKDVRHIIDPKSYEGCNLIIRTIRWAANNGIVVTLSPC